MEQISAVRLYHEPKFAFRNLMHSGACDVKVYEAQAQRVALVTEPIHSNGEYASEGLSVVNGIEWIAAKLSEEWAWDYFIEYIPIRGMALRQRTRGSRFVDSMFDESLAFVTFKIAGEHCWYHEPKWEHVDRIVVQRLIGHFPDWHDRLNWTAF